MVAEIPEWLGAAIIGAVFATVSFFARDFIDRRKTKHTVMANNITNLKTLHRLLTIQKRVYDLQCIQRDNLKRNLKLQFPDEIKKFVGFEEKFEGLFDKMSSSDRETHLIIRSQTKGALFPLNKKIKRLAQKIDLNLLKLNQKEKDDLKILLEELDLHLNLWLAKYEEWIPDNPKHSLVYLGDEKEHGVPFPKGIENAIANILKIY